jgi:hypothetical protein
MMTTFEYHNPQTPPPFRRRLGEHKKIKDYKFFFLQPWIVFGKIILKTSRFVALDFGEPSLMKELLLGVTPFCFWDKKFSATSGLAAAPTQPQA